MKRLKLSAGEQDELLRTCVHDKLDLLSELAKIGADYDSLIYRHDNQPLTLFDLPDRQLFRALDDFRVPHPHGIPVVSFFSGAGGLDLGFEAAGFHHLACIEINELFCDTLRANRAAWAVLGPPMHSGDIRNRDEFSHLLRQKLGVSTPFEGVFHGGPPCQPFSIASHQRFAKGDENFKRIGFAHQEYGNLLSEFVWYICEFKPRAFLIENVAGLLDMDDGAQLNQAIETLTQAGYAVTTPTILNAAHHSVPQNRLRVFIVGARNGLTVTLPHREQGIVPCVSALNAPMDCVANHLTREHKADSVLRYMELRFGQRDTLGRVDRLNPYGPSKTVIAGGVSGGGRSHLHPSIPRTLSVRESARLQTFPDDYLFCGPSARQFTQVGNAVPPLLAAKLARSIYQSVYVSGA